VFIQSPQAPDEETDSVNVLLIISEDNGPHLGCYGDRNIATPNIDRLASEGVRFENAHTTQSVCSPGRASIFTGLYPHQCGQIGLATHNYAQYEAFPNLFSLLKDHGLRTGLIGKLHVNPASDFPMDMWWNDPEFISFNNRDVRQMAQVADAFITESADPFFLTIAYPDAHLPLLRQQCGIPEVPYEADDVTVLPQVGVDSPRLRQQAADYYNCMSRLDTAVGLLLDALDRSGKAEETLVIFTTDHGAQFSRGKTTCYEGGLRVPHIVRWPGVSATGTVREELVSHVDILPSITEALGVPTPTGAGQSQVPLWKGHTTDQTTDQTATEWRTHVCAEWTGANPPCYFPQRSIRSARYKLIVNYLADRPNPNAMYYSGPDQLWKPGATVQEISTSAAEVRTAYATFLNPPREELYDLDEDPWEFNNRVNDPDLALVRDELRTELAAWQAQTDDRIVDRQVLERLTAEHDALSASHYAESARGSSGDFEWSYADYLYG
jgi:N-sulfoglucosamine sulfohydrolase